MHILWSDVWGLPSLCWVFLAVLVVGGGGAVQAQPTPPGNEATQGPGGVGATDGTSDLKLWLRSDRGVFTDTGCSTAASDADNIGCWADQSGYGNDATQASSSNQPMLDTNGSPSNGAAVSFDPSGSAQFVEGTLSKSDGVTLMALYSHQAGTVANGTLLEVHDGNRNVRNIIQARLNDNELAYYDGSNTLTGASYTGGTPVIHTATHVGTEVDVFKNESNFFSSDSETANGAASDFIIGDDVTGGNGIDGIATEVIVFSRRLNAAERIIIENYLSSKHGVSLATNDKFAYDGSYGSDVAGIGRETSSAEHLSSNSDVLNVEVGGGGDADAFSRDDQYVLLGHDDGAQEDFSTSSFDQPINGSTTNAKRIGRTWRADLTFGNGSGPKAVTISVEKDSLPSTPNAGDSYFVVVDNGSASFDGAIEVYELTGSSTLSTTVELEDGDHIAIGAGQRTVTFTSTTGDAVEGAEPSLTAELNLPYTASTNPDVSGEGTDVDVAFTHNGDLDESGNFEDAGTDQNPNSGSNPSGTDPPGSNGNNYEADEPGTSDGGDDDGDSGEGSINGDYDVKSGSTSPVTITAGSSTETVDLKMDDDGLEEQTEKFEVELDASATTNAGIGADDRVLFSVLDDDEPRDLKFADSDYTDGSDDDPNAPSTSESGGGTRNLTVKLRQDGDGTTAGSSSPYTTVEFNVDQAASGARAGTTLSNADVDFKIVDESGSGGDEYQERLSKTSGRVHFGSGATSAPLKLEISDDNLDESDEKIVLDLTNPISGALGPDSTTTTFVLEDDDSPPTVAFRQSSSQGDESANGDVDVTLSSASGDTVIVDYKVNTSSSSATEGASADFTTEPAADTLQFVPLETTRSITVDVNDDSKNETNETVELESDGNGDDTSRPTKGATWSGTTSHTYTINDNDDPAIGATGPGGVGAADGSGTLKLWLRANAITDVSDGTPLSTWPDVSGNNNDAGITGGNAPTYSAAGGPNGGPEVRFDAANDEWMEGTASKSGAVTAYSVYRHQTGTIDFGTVLELDGNTRNILQARPPDDDIAYYDGSSTLQDGTYSSGEDIIQGVTHSGGQQVNLFKNGNSVFSTGTAASNASTSNFFLGNDRSDGNEIDGAASEAFFFSVVLNDTRRTLIENYLSAKYDIGLNTGGSAKDVYAGDNSGNGDYDRGVFGIGREAVGDFHFTATTDGLQFTDPSGVEDGDYLTAGHRTAENTVNVSDVNGVSGLDARLERAWYADLSNDGGTSISVDVTVDLSEAGLSGPAGTAGDYVLLQRTADAADGTNWTNRGTAASISNGDEITFSNVSLTDGTEITLGTTDQVASPLGGTKIVLQGTAGNENSVNDVNLSGDAGFALLGPPESGGTFEGLASDTDPQLIEFGLPRPMIYTYKASTDDWVEVNGADSDTSIPSGEGFLLFVFDDKGSAEADPVDPTLPITVTDGSGPPSSNVTRSGLGTGDQWVFLSNPYDVPFNLEQISASGNGQDINAYSTTVQVWDRIDETWNPGLTLDAAVDTDDTTQVGVGQGFFLECTDYQNDNCPTDVTLPTSGKVPSSREVIGFEKTAESSKIPSQLAALDLSMHVTQAADTVAQDQAAQVLFYDGATDRWDRYDATKLAPFLAAYATLSPLSPVGDTMRAAAQASRAWPTEQTVEVPLAVTTVGVSGTATVEADTLLQVPDDWEVTLVDTKGTADPSDDEQVSWTEGASYTFTLSSEKGARTQAKSASGERSGRGERQAWTPGALALQDTEAWETARISAKAGAPSSAKATEVPDSRLVLRVEPNSNPLPVELATLSAQQEDENAVLSWTTASETQNAGFYVEHRRRPADSDTTTAGSWESLGFVEGRGTTAEPQTYRYRTEPLKYGTHAFRLRQIDTDGAQAITDSVIVERRLQGAYDVQAPYPNPASRQVTLPVTVQEEQAIRVRIYDVLGRQVHAMRVGPVPGQRTQSISIATEKFGSGKYFLRVKGKEFITTKSMTIVK